MCVTFFQGSTRERHGTILYNDFKQLFMVYYIDCHTYQNTKMNSVEQAMNKYTTNLIQSLQFELINLI